jgi:aconitate hydratase
MKNTRDTFDVNGKQYTYFNLNKVGTKDQLERLPISLRILLENACRRAGSPDVHEEDIQALLAFGDSAMKHEKIAREVTFMPARVLMQDFTGVPAIVDLAAMRDAMKDLGGDPEKINPLQAAELVIDHSVQVDAFGSGESIDMNNKLEVLRNKERYQFLRWGQKAFSNFSVVPPDTGIVHQVNLEYLARVAYPMQVGNETWVYPDTLVGTDSHTTMINGLGVLGWGVGGIEAEAAMLGQSMAMLIPDVIGFKLTGKLPEGATATDLVLKVTEMLRKRGVVDKFVEFYGDGLDELPLADRATIANMAPEYGATCGFFPVDKETLNYLRLSGRPEDQIALVEAYYKKQGLFRETGMKDPQFTDTLHLELSEVVPSIAGPKRPQDRIALSDAKEDFMKHIRVAKPNITPADLKIGELRDGSVVIAAITSCTNTSNPAVMLASGLLAKRAVEFGLKVPAWVKTSLAPGSRVVTDYLKKAGLMAPLEALGFYLVGYGCTTCIGNSGPLPEEVSEVIKKKDLYVTSVLSGNRNFEGRIHPEVRMNYLASPPLVVAYALAGRMDIDFYHEPIGQDKNGRDVFLKDIWPSQAEIAQNIHDFLKAEMFLKEYAGVFDGDDAWKRLTVPEGERYAWPESTYVKKPPYFDGMTVQVPKVSEIQGARCLAVLGDSVTTDHISPAGSISKTSPAAEYLIAHGVPVAEFNSYGSRRGNHEVMVRGTFANVRLRNQLVEKEGGFTRHFPSGDEMTIFDASLRYENDKVPLVILAGQEYGSGSSRDWAAKGPKLLGVRAVIAQSYERIHRSNLIGMGILPLQFKADENAASLGLKGDETFDIQGLKGGEAKEVTVAATSPDGTQKTFKADVRLNTPLERSYYEHGGILPYVLRKQL